jgi:hypothetical protein
MAQRLSTSGQLRQQAAKCFHNLTTGFADNRYVDTHESDSIDEWFEPPPRIGGLSELTAGATGGGCKRVVGVDPHFGQLLATRGWRGSATSCRHHGDLSIKFDLHQFAL